MNDLLAMVKTGDIYFTVPRYSNSMKVLSGVNNFHSGIFFWTKGEYEKRIIMIDNRDGDCDLTCYDVGRWKIHKLRQTLEIFDNDNPVNIWFLSDSIRSSPKFLQACDEFIKNNENAEFITPKKQLKHIAGIGNDPNYGGCCVGVVGKFINKIWEYTQDSSGPFKNHYLCTPKGIQSLMKTDKYKHLFSGDKQDLKFPRHVRFFNDSGDRERYKIMGLIVQFTHGIIIITILFILYTVCRIFIG